MILCISPLSVLRARHDSGLCKSPLGGNDSSKRKYFESSNKLGQADEMLEMVDGGAVRYGRRRGKEV